MIQQVLLPKLGETMAEAAIARWLKKEGDAVKAGDILLEITTDKATLEVESYVSGTLRRILAREGETLPVNAVIALVGEPNDPLPEIAASDKVKSKEKPMAEAAASAAPTDSVASAPAPAGKIIASPRASRLAREEHINLALIRGGGPGGRIIEADVLAYLERARRVKATPMARLAAEERGVDLTGIKSQERIRRADVERAVPAGAAVTSKRGRREPLSAMRRVIAERMTQSKKEVPHFYLDMEADMGAAMALREKLKRENSLRVAFHDFLIKACAGAFVAVPAMNVAWDDGALLHREGINIGLAVALEQGLIVPVVRGAERLSLADIAKESARLIDRARGRKLAPDEYQDGCLTISNLGMMGVDSFSPTINPGESGILGVGRIAERVVARDGVILIRPMMSLTLGADHRAVDGAIAAEYLSKVKTLLENPEELR